MMFAIRLRVTGLPLRSFEVEGHIFAHVLYGAMNEHFSWNLYPHEFRGVNPSLLGVVFINVQAHRPIWKTEGVECGCVCHLIPTMSRSWYR